MYEQKAFGNANVFRGELHITSGWNGISRVPSHFNHCFYEECHPSRHSVFILINHHQYYYANFVSEFIRDNHIENRICPEDIPPDDDLLGEFILRLLYRILNAQFVKEGLT